MYDADQPPSSPTVLRILLYCVHARHIPYMSVVLYGTVRTAERSEPYSRTHEVDPIEA